MNLLRRLFRRGGGGDQDAIAFIGKHTQPGRVGGVNTYEEYKAGNAEQARRFLSTKKVTQPRYYVVVKTPDEGVWGVDVEGLYLEHLAPWQSDISLAQVEGKTGPGVPNLFALKCAAAGTNDNFIHGVICGKCGQEWIDGLRYQAVTVVKCPRCRTRNAVSSQLYVVVGLPDASKRPGPAPQPPIPAAPPSSAPERPDEKATSRLAALKAAIDEHLALLRFLGTGFPFDAAKREAFRTMNAKCARPLVPSSLTMEMLRDAPRRATMADGHRVLDGYEQLRLSLFDDLARQTRLALLDADAVDLLLEVQEEIIALRSKFYPDGP